MGVGGRLLERIPCSVVPALFRFPSESFFFTEQNEWMQSSVEGCVVCSMLGNIVDQETVLLETVHLPKRNHVEQRWLFSLEL